MAGQVIGADRLRKPGPDRARGGRGIGARRDRRRTSGSSTTRSATRSSLETVKQASDGEDIQLTLDPVIQQKTEEVLNEVGETYSPKGATAIVVDPRTSQILAMANWPPVDPDDLEDASNEDLLNQATGFNYEPGSTFKAFTVSAALEEKLVTPTTEFALPPHDPGRRPDDRRRRGTRHRNDDRRRRSWPNPRTSARSRSGSKVGATKFSKWIDTLRLRRARPGSSSRARNRGSSRRSTNTRARRWATCRSARAWR